jgi:hypothetical protein
MPKVRRAAVLGAVFGVGASLALGGPVLAQTSPSPDPDPNVRPDPIPSKTSKTTAAPQPTAHAAPTSRATPASRTVTQLLQRTPSGSVAASRPARTVTAHKKPRSRPPRHAPHTTNRAEHPAITRAAFERLTSLDVAGQLLRSPGVAHADDRRKAEALALAAIALLLVVVAEGSLLRLASRPRQRGRWA